MMEWAGERSGRGRTVICRRDVWRAIGSVSRSAGGWRDPGAVPGGALAGAGLRRLGPARAGPPLDLADPGRPARLRAAVPAGAARAGPAGSPARRDRGPDRAGVHCGVHGRGGVLAQRAAPAGPDGEPGAAPRAPARRGGDAAERGAAAGAPAWAGECWAVEAELTRKTVRRTAAIMAEILTRTGDYGCPAAEVRVPGLPPRHARVLYVCSAAARPTVIRARAALPGALAARVEVRGLPAGA